MKALVTGAAGFCGWHLVSHLLHAGYNVSGLDCIKVAHPDATIHKVDIQDAAGVQALLEMVRPDMVFHLAALTNPRLDYPELHRANAVGTLILLNAVHRVCPAVTIVVTSSSAVYGRGQGGSLPIDEDEPLRPINPYAVSKVAQEMVAYQQFAAHGLHVIRTRAFNLTGPGESASFVTAAFARQIAGIETGRQDPILQVGNLDAVRDFTDVRDAVRAYRLLAEQGEPGAVYNVCSGQGTKIRQLLDDLLTLARFPGIVVQPDPGRLQPADVPIQIGDATRLREATSWLPEIPFRQTLQDVLDHWRRHIDEEG